MILDVLFQTGMNVRSRFLQSLVVALFLFSPAFGQTPASIKGKLIDPRGYKVGDLTVVARGDVTGHEYQATTYASGSFVVEKVQPDRYTVASESEGMERSVATVTVAAGG